MYFIEKIIKEQYFPIETIKDSNQRKIIRFRNSNTKTDIKYREFIGDDSVYNVLKSVRNENLAKVYYVSKNDEKVLVVEEFIDGISVGDVLKTGLYTEDGVINIISQLCNAVYSLHENNIIHRDIKPENIIIDNNGNAYLIDFDSARLYKPYQPNDTVFNGTTGFAAPEQYGLSQTDFRTDIYALGIVMNTMLTGEHPVKKLYSRGRLSKIIERCIKTEPENRFQNIEELYKKI